MRCLDQIQIFNNSTPKLTKIIWSEVKALGFTNATANLLALLLSLRNQYAIILRLVCLEDLTPKQCRALLLQL
jgi:hypothetical protein